jgi:hypothetical protein
MGECAIERLLERIGSPATAPETIYMPVELVVRESTDRTVSEAPLSPNRSIQEAMVSSVRS